VTPTWVLSSARRLSCREGKFAVKIFSASNAGADVMIDDFAKTNSSLSTNAIFFPNFFFWQKDF
jgi:hypothetical protein